jgi:hypothetical protein
MVGADRRRIDRCAVHGAVLGEAKRRQRHRDDNGVVATDVQRQVLTFAGNARLVGTRSICPDPYVRRRRTAEDVVAGATLRGIPLRHTQQMLPLGRLQAERVRINDPLDWRGDAGHREDPPAQIVNERDMNTHHTHRCFTFPARSARELVIQSVLQIVRYILP